MACLRDGKDRQLSPVSAAGLSRLDDPECSQESGHSGTKSVPKEQSSASQGGEYDAGPDKTDADDDRHCSKTDQRCRLNISRVHVGFHAFDRRDASSRIHTRSSWSGAAIPAVLVQGQRSAG